jgi:hypothetical protein
MKQLVLNAPTFGFIVSTRAALAFGAGLLISNRIPDARRRTLGRALVAIGAATTVPAAMFLRRGGRRARRPAFGSYDERLIGVERFPRKGDDERT